MSEYRYVLHRTWSPGQGCERLVWVMLNPSTADDGQDDPTLRRCLRFSAAAGAGALTVVNLYALRATRPAGLWAHPDPVGPDNDATLTAVLATASRSGWPVVCAWGAGGRTERVRAVVERLRASGAQSLTLGPTRAGHPRHPLYVPATAAPYAYEPTVLDGRPSR